MQARRSAVAVARWRRLGVRGRERRPAAAMARARALFLLLLAMVAVGSASAGILDLLWGSEVGEAAEDGAQRGEGPAEATPLSRNCTCAGAACHCCAALDFAFIDLGGPDPNEA
ncbi:Protein of unknown function [Gryllus bimaculatus]|nr:Protein of unknown function [Gryllus bimaculatus]